jgi:LCP family protein required for cell wall assembly
MKRSKVLRGEQMKLIGNRRKGRHTSSRLNKNSEGEIKPKSKWRKRLFIIGTSFGAVVLALLVFVVVFWQREVRPPEISPHLRPGRDTSAAAAIENPSDENNPNANRGGRRPISPNTPQEFDRDPDVFTFLLLGLADWLTDVNMVGAFNAREYTLDIVSIPRDTMANVSWNVRKVNSIYGAMRNRYPNDPERVKEAMNEHFADILGFELNFVIFVDMRAFTSLVDAIDGVDFYIPVNMNYSDPEQNLFINFQRGQQRLNGQQALNVMRFRGYGDADIGRINTQQAFLMAAAQQILDNAGSINVSDLVTIFLRYVETDLTYGELIWFARAMLRMDYENINFHMMPHRLDSVGGLSYVSILLDEWLELVNDVLNPFTYQITQDSETLSILTRGPDGRLFVTDDNWQGSRNWGQGTVAPRPQTTPAAPVTPPATTPPATTPPPSDDTDPPDDDTQPYDPDEPNDEVNDEPDDSPYGEDSTDIPPGDEPYPSEDDYYDPYAPPETPPDTEESPPDEPQPPDSPPEDTPTDTSDDIY